MAQAGVPGSARRRPTLACSASLALHGALWLLVVVLTGTPAVRSPRHELTVTSIEVVSAAPSPPSVPPQRAKPVPRATASVTADTRARRQQLPRSQPSAPAARAALADLALSYDDPTDFVNQAATTVDGAGDSGRSGIGTGIDRHLGDDLATLQIPQPVSLARSLRPKFDYNRLRLHGASKFAGLTIKILVHVDPHGRVGDVRLLEGVDADLDRRTVALARRWEFEPARNEAGAAIPAASPWNIQIVEDDDEPWPTDRGRIHD